jgi:hypothetical protein
MVYPLGNHQRGVKNEIFIVIWMNEHPDNNITKYLVEVYDSLIILWIHKGGTKQTRDACIQLNNGEIINFSIKNHKTGTFDWINTTDGVNSYLKEEIKKFKVRNMDTPIPKKGGIRSELENIFSFYLDNLSSENIRKLLGKCYNKLDIIITDHKTKKLILIPYSYLDKYFNPLYNDYEFVLRSTHDAKTSRQIYIRSPDGKEINTNLRIRLLLNNGITALLGKSKKNKTSVPCLKIQQDNVDEFIRDCDNKVSADIEMDAASPQWVREAFLRRQCRLNIKS